MGGSNAEWGALAARDPELAALWDTGVPLPADGAWPELDALMADRHIQRVHLARTGCRRAGEGADTLMWAWPGGAKWRNLKTGRRWTTLDARWTRAHVMSAWDGDRASVLLVAEGETDSARLADMYPFADVAVLPGGADYVPPELPLQAAGYGAVYACHDADPAGDAGAEHMAELLPQSVRHRPPAPYADWCELPADAEAPALPSPPDCAGTIVFEPYAETVAAGIPEPEQILPNMLYAGALHWLDGHPGGGKTTIAGHMAARLMQAGRHCVWLDYEAGLSPTARRLEGLRATTNYDIDLLHYAGWPTAAETSLSAVAARWPGALVVIDSASKALSFAGHDESDNTAVTQWTLQLVQAAKLCHLPIVVIDHVDKGGQHKKYARGAGAKRADTDVHWRATSLVEFSRTTSGLMQLKRLKDREGYFPGALYFELGGGGDAIPIALREAPTSEELSSREADIPDGDGAF